jgi:hypothetical protein
MRVLVGGFVILLSLASRNDGRGAVLYSGLSSEDTIA